MHHRRWICSHVWCCRMTVSKKGKRTTDLPVSWPSHGVTTWLGQSFPFPEKKSMCVVFQHHFTPSFHICNQHKSLSDVGCTSNTFLAWRLTSILSYDTPVVITMRTPGLFVPVSIKRTYQSTCQFFVHSIANDFHCLSDALFEPQLTQIKDTSSNRCFLLSTVEGSLLLMLHFTRFFASLSNIC